LWALVPLAAGGASEEAVRQARDAIEGREGLSEAQRADHLAVLMFVAEAEGVPLQAMRDYISEEKLMASTLYQEILAKGVAQGEVRGLARGIARGEARGEARADARRKKETISLILAHRLGSPEPEVHQRIWNLDDPELLTRWYEEALLVVDAESARELVERVKRAPVK
jgi:predicted transposase YdaD